MKTLKLFTLAAGLVLLSSTVFANQAIENNKKADSTKASNNMEYLEWESSSDPLQEVLEMEEIPVIIIPIHIESTLPEDSDYTDPLQAVLDMEEIPAIQFELLSKSIKKHTMQSTQSLDEALEESVFPLQEVMLMEAIPTIKMPTRRAYTAVSKF